MQSRRHHSLLEQGTTYHLRFVELVEELIADDPEAFMLADDSVQDKRYSRFIELIKLQYSSTEHGLVRGIGIVNLVHSAGV